MNIFSQPLTLIECSRGVPKGLDMFSSKEVCRGGPHSDSTHLCSFFL